MTAVHEEVISGVRDLKKRYLNQDMLGSGSENGIEGRYMLSNYRAFSDLSVKLGSGGIRGNGTW